MVFCSPLTQRLPSIQACSFLRNSHRSEEVLPLLRSHPNSFLFCFYLLTPLYFFLGGTRSPPVGSVPPSHRAVALISTGAFATTTHVGSAPRPPEVGNAFLALSQRRVSSDLHRKFIWKDNELFDSNTFNNQSLLRGNMGKVMSQFSISADAMPW